MIIWILLFLFVLLLSFVLALRSMKQYRERPSNLGTGFSLYLIQSPGALNQFLLGELAREVLDKKLLLSFERLYKGSRKALLVYGPTNVLQPKTASLGLLELEEYASKTYAHTISFEVGEKANGKFQPGQFRLQSNEFGLQDHEEIWWQVVAKPQIKGKDELSLNSVIRVVIHANDATRLPQIQLRLISQIHDAGLTRLPQTHSSSKILGFYKERAIFNLFSSGKEYLQLTLDDFFSLIRSLS